MRVAFFSNSSEVCESIPREIQRVFDFLFIAPDEVTTLPELTGLSLVIVDTYSSGMDFLQQIMARKDQPGCPVLVLDHYTEKLFINNILEKGADGYLLVHHFEEELTSAIRQLLAGRKYISDVLEVYKGNTYLLK